MFSWFTSTSRDRCTLFNSLGKTSVCWWWLKFGRIFWTSVLCCSRPQVQWTPTIRRGFSVTGVWVTCSPPKYTRWTEMDLLQGELTHQHNKQMFPEEYHEAVMENSSEADVMYNSRSNCLKKYTMFLLYHFKQVVLEKSQLYCRFTNYIF